MAGVLVGAVSWLSACAPGPAKSPAQGGAAWARLTTPHFTLYTDAPADEAREVAGAFEEIYGALEDVGLPGPHAPAGPVEVAFFHDREVFRGLVPDAYYDDLLPKNDFRPVGPDAYFRPLHGRESHDPDRKPMLALYATGLQFDQRLPTRLSSALRHQLTHRLVAHDLPAAPTWLHEGLASFNETITLKSEGQMKVGEAPWWFPFYDDSTVVLNRSFGQAEVKFSRADLPSAASLVAADHEALFRRDASPEAIKAKMLVKTGSWTLVRTLQLGAPPFRAAFAQYLAALKRGDEPRAAWAAALRGNGITPERLEAEYRATSDRWVSDHDTRAYAPRRPAQAQVRPMSEAEVHVLWARVAPWHGDHLT
ncbi:MAG TPA: hypothetical protein VFS00_24685, partial [Polyangiaceae bacterium]|nr:hypothetical protein [Polyangiaceae bacterium]